MPGDSTVFEWRDKTLHHPFWSQGFLVVREVPSGNLIYRGRPPPEELEGVSGEPGGSKEEAVEEIGGEEEHIRQLCDFFPSRLGREKATELLEEVGGDVNMAMGILLDEDEAD